MKTVLAVLAVSVLLGAFAIPAMNNFNATQKVAQQPPVMQGVVWTSADAGVLVESGEWFCIIPNSAAQYRMADANARNAFISKFGPNAQTEWTQQACGANAATKATSGGIFESFKTVIIALVLGKLTFWAAVATQFIVAVGLMAYMAIKKASNTAVLAVGVLSAFAIGVWQLQAKILVEVIPILFTVVLLALIKNGYGIGAGRVSLGHGRDTAWQGNLGPGGNSLPVPESLVGQAERLGRVSTPMVISAQMPARIPASRQVVEVEPGEYW